MKRRLELEYDEDEREDRDARSAAAWVESLLFGSKPQPPSTTLEGFARLGYNDRIFGRPFRLHETEKSWGEDAEKRYGQGWNRASAAILQLQLR